MRQVPSRPQLVRLTIRQTSRNRMIRIRLLAAHVHAIPDCCGSVHPQDYQRERNAAGCAVWEPKHMLESGRSMTLYHMRANKWVEVCEWSRPQASREHLPGSTSLGRFSGFDSESCGTSVPDVLPYRPRPGQRVAWLDAEYYALRIPWLPCPPAPPWSVKAAVMIRSDDWVASV
jgi:hypothetical protein